MTLNVSETGTTVPEELLDELTAWPPGERLGMLRHILRGALSMVQLNVIAVLETHGPLSMSRLAEALDVSVASATGIVDRMEHRGLVTRHHEEDDRRIVVVSLTEAGAHVFLDIAAHRRERMARLLRELNEDELSSFVAGVRAMRAARARLAAQDAEASGIDGGGCERADDAGRIPSSPASEEPER